MYTFTHKELKEELSLAEDKIRSKSKIKRTNYSLDLTDWFLKILDNKIVFCVYYRLNNSDDVFTYRKIL